MSEKNHRYLDPLSDFGFKHFFGRESNKDILIDFLNVIFEDQKKIANIIYNPTEYAGEYKELKKVYFDVLCTGENGEQFIIEMQRNPQRYFRERCIYYLSRLFNEQLPRGESNWNAEFKEIYLIGVVEFPLEYGDEKGYLHHISLVEKYTKKLFYEKIGIKFIELPNFNKPVEKLTTDLDKWLYILKNIHELTERPDVLDSPVFEKIFKIAELANLTKEERMDYDSGLKAYWDYHNSIAYAAEIAEEKGERQKAIEIAIELKMKGFSKEEIAEITKLPVQEIENLDIPA
ncbi:Rpn family recombination-promoting nuclease/putative transposase [Pedobacter sp. L105]|uniref:Rpn family recombination-promoting nuclease/putative transposase n=1 Tax=Pedobacter sp. L105 TaxID=1641871 RepID=UPI00131A76BC|nr:Rpn family recombination-promoting nuclease/putative transposase [Pedobacter sp. L105]